MLFLISNDVFVNTCCVWVLKVKVAIKTNIMSTNKIVKMEDILHSNIEHTSENEKPLKNIKEKQKSKKTKLVTLRGKPKSGRIWKSEKTKFSSIIKTRGIRSSFERKLALKEQLKRVKEASNAIKSAKEEEKQLKKQRRRENLKRQEENRRKSEVVQPITNTKKLKKIKRKHLRTIEKRDITVISK